MTEPRLTTPTSTRPAASGSTQTGADAGARVQLKSALRGLDLQAQEAMLQPVQRKRPNAGGVVQREESAGASEGEVGIESEAEPFDDAALYDEAEIVSADFAESRGELRGLLSAVPAAARDELSAILAEAEAYEDEMWHTLEEAVAGQGEAGLVEAFHDACARVDLGAELCDAHHALWSAFISANVLELARILAGFALAGIENLRAKMAEVEAELRALEAKVAEAKQQLLEVAAQTGLDIAVDLALPALLAAIGITNPLVLAAVAVGGFAVTCYADNALGVDTAGAHKLINDSGDLVDGTASGAEGITHLVKSGGELGKHGKAIADGLDGAGKGLTGLGLALDAWEAKIGYENLAALRAEAQTKLDKARQLSALWAIAEPHIATLQRLASGLAAAVPAARETMNREYAHIGQVRADLAAVGG